MSPKRVCSNVKILVAGALHLKKAARRSILTDGCADELGHLGEVGIEVAVAVLVEFVVWALAGNVGNLGAQLGVLELPISSVDLLDHCLCQSDT